MATTLWHLELSPYSEKVRWALAYKGVAHELREPMPGLHQLRALALTRGRHRRLPVMDIDGRRVADSTAILEALEERYPTPALFPADGSDYARALAFEDFFDERLAPYMRSFMWHYALRDTDAVIAALFSTPAPARERLLRSTMTLARPFVRRDYRTSATDAEVARASIRIAMDHLEAELGPSGYLVGNSFTVADLSAAALFTPLLAPPNRPFLPRSVAPEIQDFRDELLARRGGAWVHEMYLAHRLGASSRATSSVAPPATRI
jgi:glutathione S-transferase